MREHSLKILSFSVKSLWLLLLPIAQAIFTRKADLSFWENFLSTAYLDIIVLLLVVLAGYLKWSLTFYRFDNKSIIYSNFMIVRKTTVIEYKDVSSVSAKENLFLKIFGSVIVNIDTSGGTSKKTDMQILMRSEDWKVFSANFQSIETEKKNFKFKYKSSLPMMVMFSFLFSSSLSGVVYVATLIIQLGKTAGDLIMSQRASFDTLSIQMAEHIALKIPPIGIALGLVLIGTKLLSFILNLLRYANFSIENSKSSIVIKSGLFAKREFFIKQDKINFIDLGQNFLMKIFNLVTINVNCSGYGNSRNEIPVFLPIMGKTESQKILQYLYLNGKIKKPTVKTAPSSFYRFVFFPVFLLALLFTAKFFITKEFPYYRDVFDFFTIILCIPIIWAIIVKFTATFNTGYTVENNTYYIKVCKGLKFYNITVPQKNILKITKKTTLIQKLFKECDLIFELRSDYKGIFKIPSVTLRTVTDSLM